MKDNKSETPKPIRKLHNKKITPKPPKFNFIWIYAIILVGLVVVANILNGNNGKEIDYQKFEATMLKTHDVDKLVAYKSGDLVMVEVYIKKDSLKKPQYADVRQQRSIGLASTTPQYVFTDASYESLKNSINAAEKDFPENQKTPIQYQSRDSLWTNWFFQGIIMVLLFIGVWLFIMRRMSGGAGGGPGGQIFNIGKSKATLFDKESHVTVTFNDVAGLEEAKQEVM